MRRTYGSEKVMVAYEELEIIYQDDDIPSVESEINLEEVENENQIDG